MRKKLIATIVTSIFFLIGMPSLVKADNNGQTTTGFTVETIQPETQVDKNLSLYYISVKPNEPQTIQMKIISTQKEKKTVEIFINDAVTNKSGRIEYGFKKPILDESLKTPLTSIAKVKDSMKKVTVANFEEKIVEIEITPPKESFAGVKLGAIQVLAVDSEDSKESGVSSRYGYSVSLMVTEDNGDYREGGDLRLKRVEAGVEGGKKVVKIPIQNYQPKVMKGLSARANFTKKGSKEVIQKREIKNLDFAPNSTFQLDLDFPPHNLEPGKYVAKIHVSDGERKWDWEEEFEITANQAEKLNKDAIFKLQVVSWVKWASIILFVVLILLTGTLYLRKKKWQKNLQER